MESLLASSPANYSANRAEFTYEADSIKYNKDSLVIQHMQVSYQTDSVEIGFGDLYKGLTISAQQIVDKLNEMLKAELPNGLQSLKPEDVTPEATASRIVSGTTAMFDAFAKKHPELEGEELLTGFMDTIRGGIQQGYDDAYGILKGLGAFEFEGVEDGIKKTMQLVEEKLKAFEEMKRKELGLDTSPNEENYASPARSETLAQGGASLIAA